MSVTTHGSQQGSTTLSKDIEMLDPLSSPDAFLNRASINQTILGKIVAAKQEWVAARKLAQPLESFQGALVPSDRDFEGDLRAGSTRFILECKKASPSKGLIRDDFSPEAIADIYGNYATAISVLTDEQFFQGDFAFLPRVRGRVKQPVLCKDFMIDPYQVYLARHYQADAILLMLSVLTDEGYRALFAVARELGLGVLTEVSLKVLPKPRSSLTLRLEMDAETALLRFAQWGQLPLPITAACHDGEALMLRLEGGEANADAGSHFNGKGIAHISQRLGDGRDVFLDDAAGCENFVAAAVLVGQVRTVKILAEINHGLLDAEL